MLEKNFLDTVKDILARLGVLERSNQVKNIKIPTGGKLIVNSESADPPVENGKIYYNTASNKFRVCENGAWRNMG